MNIEAEKLELIKQILQLEDEEVFARLKDAVRKSLQMVGATKPTLPKLSDEEVGRRLQESRLQAAAGEVVSTEEIKALAQQWRTT